MRLLIALIAATICIWAAAPGFAASCPEGKITCAAWCAKYKSGPGCLTGPGDTCEHKKGGNDACVRAGNKIPCTAWCDKCKPNAACYGSCRSTGNRLVNNSCAVRGRG